MNASESSWQRLQVIVFLLLVLTLCLYLPTLFHYGFADDEIYLAYTNRFLREAPWSDLYQLFLKPANPWEFLPLRDFTYWLDFRLYGDETGGFHATNLVWYAVSGLAVFTMFREFILLCRPEWREQASALALCGTLVFMVHPAHVEVAAWIASRKDLIAGTMGFFSLALLAHAIRRHGPCFELALAALLMFAACFGKASAMTGVLVVTAVVSMGWKSSPEISRAKKLLTLSLFWALIAVAFLIHLKVGEHTGIRIENHPGMFVMIERASRIFATLIGILLFPYPLHFYYDVYQLEAWHWLVSASAALLLFEALYVLLKRRALWALGVVLALTPLFVYLQMMPFTTWSLASERFVFVSVAGLALVMIDLFGRMGRPKIVGGLLILMVLFCAPVVWSRIDEWEGHSHTLFAREYELQPGFHNVIRDRIYFTLLPEKRYDEATELARQLPRAYAAAALFALIGTEQAYRRMSDAKHANAGEVDGVLRQNFCSAVAGLRTVIHAGFEHIPSEPDLSYNNLLRSLDKQMKFRYADDKILCVSDGFSSK